LSAFGLFFSKEVLFRVSSILIVVSLMGTLLLHGAYKIIHKYYRQLDDERKSYEAPQRF
jgi:hypothetical protein